MVFKALQIFLLSSVKLFFGVPWAYQLGFNFFETVLLTTTGGVAGVFFFFYLSEIINRWWSNIFNPFCKQRLANNAVIGFFRRIFCTDRPKRKFTRKNKIIIYAKRKWGLIGIAILTPLILSIPVGTFLADRYYKNKKQVLLYLCICVFVWSVIFSLFFGFFDK